MPLGPAAGGLGLMRAEWEAAHGAPTRWQPADGGTLATGTYADGWEVRYVNDRIHALTRPWTDGQGPPSAQAVALGERLLLADAYLVRTVTLPPLHPRR